MPTGIYKGKSNKDVHMGQKVSLKRRLQTSKALKGIPKSEEHKNNILNNIPRGINHYRYQIDRNRVCKNRAYDLKGHDWMLNVKRRDKWTCALKDKECNGRLEAHHILSWSEYPNLRYIVKNGISLCHFHHPRKRSEEKRMVKLLVKLVYKIYESK